MSLTTIWDGTSRTRPNPSIARAPDGADYDRITRELQQTQAAILQVDSRFAAETVEVIKPGHAVRIREIDGKLRKADHAVSGLVAGVALNGGPTVFFIQEGNVELADWSQVTGAMHLSPGVPYYLGSSGTLITTPVSTGFHVKIGLAVNQTILSVKISESVRL